MGWVIEVRGRVLSRHGSLREALRAADHMGRRLNWAVIRSESQRKAAR